MRDVLAFAAEKVAEGRRVALVTVTETDGSSPATPGQVMAVAADGEAAGTVGGGATEYALVRRAMEAIAAGERVFSFSYSHAESGMTCGGSMAGFGNVLGAGARVVIFGGGHIAQSLAPLAAATGFSVCVVDNRPGLEQAHPNARFVLAGPAEYESRVEITHGDYVVICTHGHAQDEDALRFCMAKAPAYLGMIGSRAKVRALFDHLRAEGVPDEALDRVYSPIGLAIATGAPAEIAVSILAEILLVKNGGAPRHMKHGAAKE